MSRSVFKSRTWRPATAQQVIPPLRQGSMRPHYSLKASISFTSSSDGKEIMDIPSIRMYLGGFRLRCNVGCKVVLMPSGRAEKSTGSSKDLCACRTAEWWHHPPWKAPQIQMFHSGLGLGPASKPVPIETTKVPTVEGVVFGPQNTHVAPCPPEPLDYSV